MSNKLANYVEQRWYSSPGLLWLFLPLAKLYRFLSKLRRARQQPHAKALSVPVCIVGNISVGGTGKTPTIIALVSALAKQGVCAGVVARGYGSRLPKHGIKVLDEKATAGEVGDEPLLIYRRCDCPVAVGSDRVAAAEALLAAHKVDIILSDDGMQHYRLSRQLEVALLDGDRLLGNGNTLPVGPLREPVNRLAEVDWLVINGETSLDNARPTQAEQLNVISLQSNAKPCFRGKLNAHVIVNLKTNEPQSLTYLESVENVVAVAGIGNPNRFFSMLDALGVRGFMQVPFSDHHAFSERDFEAYKDKQIVMTEKDAVKCLPFAEQNMWYIPVELDLPQAFLNEFCDKVKQVIARHGHA